MAARRTTPEDEAFMRRVAKEFSRARAQALDKGLSVEEFVATLGVTRAAFHKYVNLKSIPSLRVLNRARRYWGVDVNYGKLGSQYVKTAKKDPRQMEFHFPIAEVSPDQIQIKRFSPKGEKSVELVININFSKRA